MEDRHPIPQDITGFKFRLVGDITLKQFTYLAGGGGAAWLCYSLAIWGPIKFTFIGIFVLTTLILAFLPIQGRPADAMLALFFKTVFRNNQYTKKTRTDVTMQSTTSAPTTPVTTTEPVQQTSSPTPSVATEPTQPATVEKQTEQTIPVTEAQLDLSALHTDQAPVTPSVPTVDQNQPEEQMPSVPSVPAPVPSLTVEEVPEEKAPEQPIAKTTPQENSAPLPTQTDTPPVAAADAEKDALAKRIQELEEQLNALKTPIAEQPQAQAVTEAVPPTTELETPAVPVSIATNEQPVAIPTPENITEQSEETNQPTTASLASNIPVSDTPNMVSGVIVDPRGKPLANILVEIIDAEKNPVRAFKTQQNGQFATSTPLALGTYTLTCEDPDAKQKFEPIPLVIDNTVRPAMTITSLDEREELRRELFKPTV